MTRMMSIAANPPSVPPTIAAVILREETSLVEEGELAPPVGYGGPAVVVVGLTVVVETGLVDLQLVLQEIYLTFELLIEVSRRAQSVRLKGEPEPGMYHLYQHWLPPATPSGP